MSPGIKLNSLQDQVTDLYHSADSYSWEITCMWYLPVTLILILLYWWAT